MIISHFSRGRGESLSDLPFISQIGSRSRTHIALAKIVIQQHVSACTLAMVFSAVTKGRVDSAPL